MSYGNNLIYNYHHKSYNGMITKRIYFSNVRDEVRCDRVALFFFEKEREMKYLKALLFIFGVMLFGASVKMDVGGDSPFLAFLCYGFFAVSIMIAWCEMRKLLLEMKG
ncbi:TPA: hypothetical protein QH537_002371 [Enterobacter hormaechei subsp. steigerwaltii]|nr:hypothetical protein [Enterobacter hormaechei subsp. steigerwaltii]HDT0961871.1 hypothetical protein [Enterobacter hormaechei subsp. steigerwaltii]